MIFQISALFFLVIGTTNGAPAESACPGGYKEGEKVDKSSAWYECKDGQLIPKGCLTQNGDRLKIQDTFDWNNIRSRCQLSENGPTMVNETCLQEKREHQPDDRWDDSKYVYICKKDGASLAVQPAGCIRDGQKVNLGEKMAIGDVVYECKVENAGFPTFQPWGCAKNGKQYSSGEKFDDGRFWYACENKNGVVTMNMGGCVHENKQFRDGDKFFNDDIILECVVKQNDGFTKVVGCMQNDRKIGAKIERRVGCTWYEGDEPFQVTMTCVPDQETKTATQTAVRCNYKMPGATIFSINIGCYRVYDNVTVGCTKSAGGKVNVMQLQTDGNGEIQSNPDGLKFC